MQEREECLSLPRENYELAALVYFAEMIAVTNLWVPSCSMRSNDMTKWTMWIICLYNNFMYFNHQNIMDEIYTLCAYVHKYI